MKKFTRSVVYGVNLHGENLLVFYGKDQQVFYDHVSWKIWCSSRSFRGDYGHVFFSKGDQQWYLRIMFGDFVIILQKISNTRKGDLNIFSQMNWFSWYSLGIFLNLLLEDLSKFSWNFSPPFLGINSQSIFSLFGGYRWRYSIVS